MCEQVIIIAGGKIVAEGTPDQLRDSRRLTSRVLVECGGSAGEVKDALSHVGGVDQVEILGGNGQAGGNGAVSDHFVTAAVRAIKGSDVRQELARTIVQRGWPLREVRLEHATLEEYFVQVTANQAMAKADD